MTSNLWRLSATTIVLRRLKTTGSNFDYKILLQKRGNISRAGMYTFPGGVHEKEDNDLRMTAIRELFEEAGVLLCDRYCGDVSEDSFNAWRSSVRQDPSQFQEMLNQLHARTRSSELHHFCTFMTPKREKRRYTTLFFIAEVSDDECRFMKADGTETASLSWVDPDEALKLNASGKIAIMPPQFYVLKELSQFTSIQEIISALQTEKGYEFSTDVAQALFDVRGFPAMQPHPIPQDSSEPTIALCLPYDEVHPEMPGGIGKRHRIYSKAPLGTGGYSLEKNVSSFGQVEKVTSKL
ncbi:hypothetical protein CYMTET_18419 [Cymbomonas tetramitiformis]|uniref:Nudix hydrolase domain-containing protein n=1 Tax=Cymbomonas tetramitiformis TaxID=36881 RepID=A0AAE0L5W8_9CHLO|nr:hypothetical protein CYMTET_18419 [Cymbomonas tetramitiformis]|eukprot:gene30468-38087_t